MWVVFAHSSVFVHVRTNVISVYTQYSVCTCPYWMWLVFTHNTLYTSVFNVSSVCTHYSVHIHIECGYRSHTVLYTLLYWMWVLFAHSTLYTSVLNVSGVRIHYSVCTCLYWMWVLFAHTTLFVLYMPILNVRTVRTRYSIHVRIECEYFLHTVLCTCPYWIWVVFVHSTSVPVWQWMYDPYTWSLLCGNQWISWK
jgi:hypothetical protein